MENIKNFIDSLSFMGIGMASIIIVIGVLILAVLILGLFSSNKMKISRKIILVVALAVLLVSVSLLNGINMNKKVTKYVEENEEKIVAAFDGLLGIGGLDSQIEVTGRSFIITFKDEMMESVSEEEKKQIQENFKAGEPYFEQMLNEFKKDEPVLKSFEFRVCDKNDEVYLTVEADGK